MVLIVSVVVLSMEVVMLIVWMEVVVIVCRCLLVSTIEPDAIGLDAVPAQFVQFVLHAAGVPIRTGKVHAAQLL